MVVMDADVKNAAREARAAEKTLERQERTVSDLREDAGDAAARVARAEVELKNAQTVVNGGEAPQKGLFGGLFGAKDPQVRLEKAQAELAEAKAQSATVGQQLAAAERELATVRASASQATARASQLESQLEAADEAAKARNEAKRRAMEDMEAASANHARAETTVKQLTEKLAALRAEETVLGKRKIESIALVRAATEVATHAEEANERRKAVSEMRKAEAEAAAVSRSLSETEDEAKAVAKKLESAQLMAAQTRAELGVAERAYEPFLAQERAAAAAAAREAAAEEARIAAEQQRKEAEKAQAEAEKLRLKQQAAAAKEAEERQRELAKQQAAEAKRQAREAEAAQKAAAEAAELRQAEAARAAAVAAAARAEQDAAARQAALEAERQRQEAELARRRAEAQQPKPLTAVVVAPTPKVETKPNPVVEVKPAPKPVVVAKPEVVAPKPVVKAPEAPVVKPAVKPAVKPVVVSADVGARSAELEAERRRQEEMLEQALVRQQAEEAAREAAAEAARRERDAEKIARIEAERAERARQREEAANAVTHEGPYNALPDDASARSAEEGSVRYDVCSVVVTGDREAVYELENWSDYENDALYQPMSDKDIESFRQRILKDLQDQGYVFATVSIFKPSLNLGFLKLRVHVGQQGDVTVKGNRWNSAKQILEAASWKTGSRFNYREMYTDIFDLNTRPDVKINTKLKPRMDEFGNRIVDVELEVEDSWPVHGSLNLANSGSSETSDWRLRTTLQHLNLTKANDVLTLEWLTDPNLLQDVNAYSASYHRPLGDDRSLTLYGGYSESDINDVMPELDVYGSGWYAGFQYTKKLAETKEGRFDITYGWLYQGIKNSVDLAGVSFPGRDVQLSMPQLTVGYSDKEFDSLGGRNFWSATAMANFNGKLGASDYDSTTQNSAFGDGSFLIGRMQFARFQRFFAGEDAPGKWSLFFKADGQASDDALIAAVQKGIGGADTVRGYEEREVTGDYGFNTSVELRTPLVDNFIPGLKRDPDFLSANPDHWSMHRAQFILFGDFGMVGHKEPLAGESGTESLGSLGAGLRLGLTKYSQLRFDYGVPLEHSREADSTGRGHLSLQVQF